MPLGDKDIAVRRDCYIGRRIEQSRLRTGHPRLPQRHQNLSFRAELEDLLPFAVPSLFVGHPQVSCPVHLSPVREYEHALTPTLQVFNFDEMG